MIDFVSLYYFSTVTLVSAAIILILFLSELAYFLSTDVSVHGYFYSVYKYVICSQWQVLPAAHMFVYKQWKI